MRILWADDQQDVARTMAALAPPDSEVQHVADGNEALRRLRGGCFDLVVIDLAMPPGEWGGLWLLEQLTERGIDVPAIVLSGEGSQKETIAAMRLGADYVRKDDAGSELRERIVDRLQSATVDRQRLRENLLPCPIAVPYRRIRALIDSATRYITVAH